MVKVGLPIKRILLILLIVVGAQLAGSWLHTGDAGRTPAVRQGLLDLSQWNPESAPPVSLDGEWAFYWGGLLGPEAFVQGVPEPTGYLNLPGTWHSFQQGSGGLPADGFATLHLRVRIPATSHLMAVQLPAVFSAFRLWANGELIARAGTVGTAAAASRPEYLVQIAVFEPRSQTVDLVLQISNFDQRWSGLMRSIEFGTFDQVVAAKGRTLRMWAAALGGMTLLALQSLFLFFRRRRQEIYLLVGAFILGAALLAANETELIFTRMGPGFGWELHWKIQHLSILLLMSLAVRAYLVMFPREVHAGVVRATLLAAGLGALFVLLTPARIYTPFQPVVHGMGVLALTYCLGVSIKALDLGRSYGWTAFVSAVGILAWMVQSWPRYYGVRGGTELTGVVAVSVITIGLALIHLFDHRRLRKTATALESRNSSLNDRLREQVAELQAARQLLSGQEEELRRKTAEFLQSRVRSKLLVAGHHLAQVEMWLQTDPERGRGELETAQTLIEEVREKDVRSISHRLHPTAISFGLGPAVHSLSSEYLGDVRKVIEMEPEVAALDDVTENRIPERVRLAAYRVLAEALGNVRSHSGATEVAISLSVTPDGDLAMEVADNGGGFDPGAMTPGQGLRTMAARLAECGGSLNWESRPGEGTRLRVRIPLGEPEAVTAG